MAHSAIAAQLESAHKKIHELEIANTVLSSEREELNEAHIEVTRSRDFYREQYLLLVEEMHRIPAWIKSVFGV